MRRTISLVLMLGLLTPVFARPAPSLAAAAIAPLHKLSPGAAEIANKRQGAVGVAVYDLDTGAIHSFQGTRAFTMFSTAKVPIMLAVLDRAVREGRRVTQQEQGLIERMITASDNNAATTLYIRMGGARGVQSYLQRIGIGNTQMGGSWGVSTTTPQDMSRMLAKLGSCTILVQRLCNYALGVMGRVIGGQRWGVSAGVPRGATIALKNGWYPHRGGWTVNSAGLVLHGGKRYAIAVFTSPAPSFDYGIATIEQISRRVYPAVP